MGVILLSMLTGQISSNLTVKEMKPPSISKVSKNASNFSECMHSLSGPISYPDPLLSYAHARRIYDFVVHARKTAEGLGTRLCRDIRQFHNHAQ